METILLESVKQAPRAMRSSPPRYIWPVFVDIRWAHFYCCGKKPLGYLHGILQAIRGTHPLIGPWLSQKLGNKSDIVNMCTR